MTYGQTNKTPEFLARFPFGRLPAADVTEGPLFESGAIAYYVAASRPELVGAGNAYAAALIQQFLAVSDNEVNPAVTGWLYPILGYASYNEASFKKAQEDTHKILKTLDTVLLSRTFLVGDQITLADITLWCSLLHLYRLVLDASARAQYTNLTRWFTTLANQSHFKAVLGDKMSFCEKPLTYDASKSAAAVCKPCQSKPCAGATPSKPAAAATHSADEEDQPAPQEKAKNPLDLLPPSKFNLEDWKRFYSNNDTRPTAIDYFWSNYDPQGFSIWRVDYKYNDELARIFMTCNLVTGLFSRMDHLRKYTFGTVLIFGEDNANEISGYFVFRGQDIPPEMKDVPDYESYEFRRVDTNNKEERALFEDYLAWDGQLGGKKLAEGKAFK